MIQTQLENSWLIDFNSSSFRSYLNTQEIFGNCLTFTKWDLTNLALRIFIRQFMIRILIMINFIQVLRKSEQFYQRDQLGKELTLFVSSAFASCCAPLSPILLFARSNTVSICIKRKYEYSESHQLIVTVSSFS